MDWEFFELGNGATVEENLSGFSFSRRVLVCGKERELKNNSLYG